MKIESLEEIAKKLGKQERAWEKPAPLVKTIIKIASNKNKKQKKK